MRRRLSKSLEAVLGALLIAAGAAFAGTNTANLSVNATVVNDCSIAATTNLQFNSYDPLSGSPTIEQAPAVFSVSCTQGDSSQWIGLNTGQNAGHASGTTRAMAGPSSNYLSYEIYSNAGHTTVWGNTQAAGVAVPASSSNTQVQTFNAYGSIPAQQNVVAGSFSDTVLATVNF
jgi:spore coat protein U-like protein